MALNLTLWRLFLAQAESSNVTDFFGQVSGLVGLTCGAGIIWIALMVFVIQRAAERRRRAAQGLAPMPSVYTSAWRALRGERSEARAADVRLTPTPDLALLTGDLPLQQPRPTPAQTLLDDTPDDPPSPSEAETTTMPEPAPDPPDDASPDTDKLLGVWRDRATGALTIEIEGRRVSAADALRDAHLQDRLTTIVSDLGALLALPDAASLAAAEPTPSERPAPRGGSTLRRIGRVARGQPAVEPVETEVGSIADQIEGLLQSRLERDPAFHGRAIHVRPSLQGGVAIVVDDRRYEGIAEIDEPDVRALLEEVVREWEATQ